MPRKALKELVRTGEKQAPAVPKYKKVQDKARLRFQELLGRDVDMFYDLGWQLMRSGHLTMSYPRPKAKDAAAKKAAQEALGSAGESDLPIVPTDAVIRLYMSFMDRISPPQREVVSDIVGNGKQVVAGTPVQINIGGDLKRDSNMTIDVPPAS